MQGFKCDRCQKWFEGKPANLGHHEWMSGDIYSMGDVSARVKLTEFSNPVDGADLCLNCFLYCLEQFIRVCRLRLAELEAK